MDQTDLISKMNMIPVLFEKKKDCCGCGACMNICPKQAISMQEDECGFIYPVIDEEKCIRCERCKKVCAFQNRKEQHTPITCYAAVSTDKEQAEKSASAGIFAALAKIILEKGGIVFGAAFDSNWGVHHLEVTTLSDIEKIQGSKYAQSSTEMTFLSAKKYLDAGKKVLYSGTPCQIAGILEYLGKEYENFYTVDIVCHGVPSEWMLKDYIRMLGERYGGIVEEFTFRDKSNGWGINGSALIRGRRHKVWQSASSYLYYFTKGWIYRENCYSCKYATSHRPADITLGDYWGIEKQHPEFLGKGRWDEKKGISAIIVNSEKGRKLLGKTIKKKKTTFEKISAGNAQLRHPCSPGKRKEILELFKMKGWKAVDERFRKNIGFHRFSSQMKMLIPESIKRRLKRMKW